MATTDQRIKVPEGLRLGDLLDAIDHHGPAIARARHDNAGPNYPHGFGYLANAVGALLAGRRTDEELRRSYAIATLETALPVQYALAVAMADDRRDAVEHAPRLAAETTADDGPVAA